MRRVIAGVGLIGIILMIAAPASALRPDRFQPGPNPDLTVEGICDFTVFLHDVVNEEVFTDFFDQDGNFTRELISGRLIEEFTRLDDQGEPVRSITRNISGPGVFTFDEDGATIDAYGQSLFWFFPGEVEGFPDGLMWLTTGHWVWRFEDSGTITLISQTGTFQDVCELLA
jgi:hypothetical protein